MTILRICRFPVAPVTVGICFWILNNPPMLPGVAGSLSTTAPDLRTLHIRLLETLLVGITILALTLKPNRRSSPNHVSPLVRSARQASFLSGDIPHSILLRSSKAEGVLQRTSGNRNQPAIPEMRAPSALAAALLILLTVGAACLFVQNLNSVESKQITRSYDAH